MRLQRAPEQPALIAQPVVPHTADAGPRDVGLAAGLAQQRRIQRHVRLTRANMEGASGYQDAVHLKPVRTPTSRHFPPHRAPPRPDSRSLLVLLSEAQARSQY